MNERRLHRVNNLLLTLILLVCAYIMVVPFTPQLSFWWQSRHSQQRAILNRQIQADAPVTKQAITPADSLTIPAMLFSQTIHEASLAQRYQALHLGVWRYTSSSTPDKGGNTVLLAHRFTYTNPRGAFYFLDKLQPGDTIGLVWQGKHYTYQVASSQVVPASDTAILANSDQPQLTLFTCTPLLHPVNRLVVTAKLVAP